jgi:hypothetical protein
VIAKKGSLETLDDHAPVKRGCIDGSHLSRSGLSLRFWKKSGGMEVGFVSSGSQGDVLVVRSEGRHQDDRTTNPGG